MGQRMHHRPRNVGVAGGVGAGCTVGDLAAGGRAALDGQAGGGDVVPAGVSFDAAPLDCVLRLEYQRIFGFKTVVNRRGAQEEVAHQVEPAAPHPCTCEWGHCTRRGNNQQRDHLLDRLNPDSFLGAAAKSTVHRNPDHAAFQLVFQAS